MTTMTAMLPERWSYSSLSTWSDCPRRWHASYIDKLRSDSFEARRGTIAHEALEMFAALPVEDRTLNRLLEFGSERLRAYDGEFAGNDMDAAVEERLHAAWHLESWVRVPATMIEAELSMTTAGGRQMRGFADRVDEVNGELIVTDFKSGKPSKWAWAGVSKQIACYILMLKQTFADAVVQMRGRAVYLGAGTDPSNIALFSYDEDDLESVEVWIDRTVDDIEHTYATLDEPTAEDIPASPSPLCGWCPIKDTCSASTAR
jgi:RecB family exonuclease